MASFLRQIDCRIGDGETTAVVLEMFERSECRASVGDSRAVIVKGGTMCELTANQKRKPLMCTGWRNRLDLFIHHSMACFL